MSLKLQRPMGVPASWITTNFNACPHRSPEGVLERYVKVWLWHFSNALLLLDRTFYFFGPFLKNIHK